jgi:hypothetical protein
VFAAATLEITAASIIADVELQFLYIFLIVFAAMIFPARRDVVLWVAICGLLLLVPILFSNEHDRVDRGIGHAGAIFPGLIAVAVAIAYLREEFVAQRRRLHELAAQTIDLTQRIGQD